MPGTIQDVLDGQSLVSDALVRRIADRFKLPMDFFSAEPITGKTEVTTTPGALVDSSIVRSTRAQRVDFRPESLVDSSKSDLDDVRRTQKALVELLIDKGVIQPAEWQSRLRRTKLSD